MLFILIVGILLTVFFMERASVSIIKFNFRLSVDEDLLRRNWNGFCDFGSDLSSLRRTEKSVVFDISHVVMGFWGFDLEFGRWVDGWGRLSFLDFDSIANGLNKKLLCEVEGILRSSSVFGKIVSGLRRGV